MNLVKLSLQVEFIENRYGRRQEDDHSILSKKGLLLSRDI